MTERADQARLGVESVTALTVAAAIVSLALLGGGAGGAALGVATAAVWSLLGLRALAGGARAPAGGRELALAAGSLLALGAWGMLSVRWGAEDGAAFFDLVQALGYLGAVLAAALLARPGSGPSWLAGIGLGGVVVASIAIAGRLTGIGDDAELAAQLPAASERISFPLGYWNALGYLLAMSLPALAMLASAAPPRIARHAVAGSVPVVLALYLTYSRGALLAAALGLALIALLCRAERPRLASGARAVAVPWVALVLLAAASGDGLEPGGAPLLLGLLVAGATLTGMRVASRLFERDRGGSGRLARALGSPPTRRRVLAFAGAALVAAVLVIGPGRLIGEFRTERATGEQGTGQALASASGRGSFWGEALEAFGSDPLRGIGSGGYGSWWAANGELRVSVQNAHSSWLETLAELGLPGLAALAGLLLAPLLAAGRQLRSRGRRVVPATAVAVYAAGLVAITIDWTWELPAAMAPMLLSAGLLAGGVVGSPRGGTSRVAGRADVAVRGALVGVAAFAVGAALLLGVSRHQLDRSEELLAAGDVPGAARAARSSLELEPWAAEPRLQLAEIEELADNLDAARRRAEGAARLAPDDFRAWALLATIHTELGNDGAAAAYANRALGLGLGRVSTQPVPR